MAELPHSVRRFRSPPPHLGNELQSWFDNLVAILRRNYRSIRTVTVDTDFLYDDSVLVCDSTAANITAALPPAAFVTGQMFTIVKTVAVNSVILDGFGSETINGAATRTLTSQWESVLVISDGTQWLVLVPS